MSGTDNLYDFLKARDWMPKGVEFAQSRKGSNNWTGTFTDMQQEVLDSSEFWDPGKNIVIHGPTSSGKTLLAEIAALHQIVDPSINEHKVLFLVPLRALVTSQCRQFQRDFCNVKRGEQKLRIFESSADYQDHDAQILSGDYDIAVVVYEKFFSMLNNQNRMLDNCGLIVVDELQMLSNPDRGPKMEFSIMKVLETQQKMQKNQTIRIIGLTTSESGVDTLCRWLDAERLGNDIRPVALKQYFVSFNPANMGKCCSKYIPGAGEQMPDSDTGAGKQEDPEPLNVPPAVPSQKKTQDEDKKRCLFALLGKWMDKASAEKENEKKILIFNNAKRSGRTLAKEIAAKFPLFTSPKPLDTDRREKLKKTLDNALQEFSDEEDVNELGRLISHGIAFHHSGLPSTVREAIEEDFRDQNGQIQIIVCTETLMIGVNLPADVVILYDSTVFRGASTPYQLAPQEYKNFIGRAGRLGFSDAGESYLLTDKLTVDFEKYTSDKKTEIVSPFKKDNAREIAPYFMSWIGGAENADLRIQQGLKQGFCCNQCKDDAGYITDFSKKILDCLKGLTKKDTDGTLISIVRKHMKDMVWNWKLTQSGVALAPYALTLDTDANLIDYVINHRNKLQIDKLQFKAPHTEKPVPPGPLLELLYTICQCREIDQNPALQLPTDERMSRALNDSAKKYLRKVYPKRPTEPAQNAGNRPLAQLAHMQCVMEIEELRSATRAIVLALWMAGCSIRSIRDSTNFNISISTSDVERLSESVAYLMEALSECQRFLGMEEKDSSGMHILSTSMKYGVPRSLVSLANTHARGITRPFLLKIGELANAAGKTPIECVLASTGERYRTLRDALRERDHVHNYAQQLENKSLDIPDRFRKLITALQGLDTNSNQDCALNQQNLMQFFADLSEVSDQADWGVQASNSTLANSIQVQFYHQGKTVQLYFQTLRPMLGDDNEWTQRIYQFGQNVREAPAAAHIPTQAITVLCGTPPVGEERLPADQLVISSEILGVLLLACLLEDSDNTNQLIYRILSDLKGPFILDGKGFFNAYGQIWELVKGYAHKEIDTKDTHPQLFYYPGIFDYKHSMPPAEGPQYTEFPWGQPELESHCKNRASFYHPAMRYSRQSERILENSRIIFCSTEDMPEVQKFHTTIIPEKGSDKGMDVVLREFANQLRSEPIDYQYDVGISFRGIYQAQMDKLKDALKRKGKNVLCMNTDTFERKMAGDVLVSRLTEQFSSCRHIIVCDTKEYDESLYTFTEYNVILDKLAYALNHSQKVPIYRVKIPGVLESKKLSDCFRHSFFHTYDDARVDDLANSLIQQMDEVEQNSSES